MSVQHTSRALNLFQVCLSSLSLLFGTDKAYITSSCWNDEHFCKAFTKLQSKCPKKKNSNNIMIRNKTKYFRLWWYDEVWFLSECYLSAHWSHPEVIMKIMSSTQVWTGRTDEQTDERTNGQRLAILKLLSEPKTQSKTQGGTMKFCHKDCRECLTSIAKEE